MSKPVKKLMEREIGSRLDGVQDLAVVSVVGVDGVTNNNFRGELLEKGIKVMVVKNAMAKRAFAQVGLADAADLLEGPCALAFGGESVVAVVREFLDRKKEIPALEVKGAYMEGEVFGPDRVVELSKYPTLSEALGNLSRAVTSPGSNLAGAVVGPGGIIASIVKTIEEKHADADAGADADAEA